MKIKNGYSFKKNGFEDNFSLKPNLEQKVEAQASK